MICDTGQLPAVRGRVMWERNPKHPFDIAGFNLYKQFQTVITLKENVRIDNNDTEAAYYDEFLIRLRDGKCTVEDFNNIWIKCSDHSLTPRAWQERSFCGENVTSLFATNEEVNVENKERLKKLSRPIVRIKATNSCKEAKRIRPDKSWLAFTVYAVTRQRP